MSTGAIFGGFAKGLVGGLELGVKARDAWDGKGRGVLDENGKLPTTEMGPTMKGQEFAPAAPAVSAAKSPAPTAAPAAARPAGAGSGKDAFISSMMPHALEVSRETGIDPRIVIAQAAQETGWGKSAPGNNYFGIKSHGKSGGNRLATTEVVNGQPVRMQDSFRGYADMGESARDYGSFLKSNPRYSDMLAAKGLDAQIDALGRSGYATDPQYAAKVRAIARGISVPGGQAAAPAQSASTRPSRGASLALLGGNFG